MRKPSTLVRSASTDTSAMARATSATMDATLNGVEDTVARVPEVLLLWGIYLWIPSWLYMGRTIRGGLAHKIRRAPQGYKVY
jgi:hypothetical protein